MRDRESPLEVVGWRARAWARLRDAVTPAVAEPSERRAPTATRVAYFPGVGLVPARVLSLDAQGRIDEDGGVGARDVERS